MGFLHNIVELQHGVRRRIDEDVGQCVLVVVHLIWKKRHRRPSELLQSPPSSSSIIQYISQEMSRLTTENMSLPRFQPLSEDKGKVTHVQYQGEWREKSETNGCGDALFLVWLLIKEMVITTVNGCSNLYMYRFIYIHQAVFLTEINS